MDVGLALQGELHSFRLRIGFWLEVDLHASLLMYRNVKLSSEQFTLLTGSKEPGHVAEGNVLYFFLYLGLNHDHKVIKDTIAHFNLHWPVLA